MDHIKMGWLGKSILAFFLMGMMQFLLKLSARRASLEGAVCFMLIQTIVVICIFFWREHIALELNVEWTDVTAGLCGGVGLVLFYNALHEGPVSIVFSVVCLGFLLTAILGILFLREAVCITKVVALLCGTLGLILITWSGKIGVR